MEAAIICQQSAALPVFPEYFSELFVILVRVGETGGQLCEQFQELERIACRSASYNDEESFNCAVNGSLS